MNPLKITKNNEEQIIERWLPLSDNPSYEISNQGRVRSTYNNGNTKILIPQTNGQKSNDYLFIKIDGKKHYIHQLVLKAFVGEKPTGEESDHINSDKTDNRLSNLRYLTVALNRSHKGEKHGNSKLTNEKVRLIMKLFHLHKSEGITTKKIADLFEVSITTIYAVITGKTWKHVI